MPAHHAELHCLPGRTDRYATAVEISKSRFPADLDADTLNGHTATDFIQASDYARPIGNGFGVNEERNVGFDDTVVRGFIKNLGTKDFARTFVVNYSLTVGEPTAGDGVRCSISDTNTVDTDHEQL